MSQSTTADDAEQAQNEEQEPTKVSVRTGGDMLKSVTNVLDVLVDECKFRFGEDEARVRAVDPANVGMVDLHIPAEAFDAYDLPESHVIGLDLNRLETTTGYARKGGNSDDDPGDPVLLEQVGRRIYVRVEPDDRMTRTGSFMSIDPDSIRQEPDLPNLSLPWEGEVDATQYRDALKEVKKTFDYVRLSPVVEETGNGSLSGGPQGYLSLYAMERGERKPAGSDTKEKYVRAEDEFRTQEKVLTGESGADAGDASLFSLDYLKDMADALVKAGFDDVNLRLGDEFPLKMEFHESRWGISGEFMLAPRIQDGENEGITRLDSPTWGDRYEDDETDEDDASQGAEENATHGADDDEGDDTDDEGGCSAADCPNPVSEDALDDGYPLCEDHDTDDARELYDSRNEEDEE